MVKNLSIIVAGQEIKMGFDGQVTVVTSGKIISLGNYLMKPTEVEEMIYRRVARDNLRIRSNKNF